MYVHLFGFIPVNQPLPWETHSLLSSWEIAYLRESVAISRRYVQFIIVFPMGDLFRSAHMLHVDDEQMVKGHIALYLLWSLPLNGFEGVF